MTDMSKWDHKDEWRQRGKDFLVVVSRHQEAPSPYHLDEGLHRWAVYVYVYPPHRLFASFKGPDVRQPAVETFPLHSGPSLLRWHYDGIGAPLSVQVGADYNHLHDTRFTHYATPDAAREVFRDADRLFDYLGHEV